MHVFSGDAALAAQPEREAVPAFAEDVADSFVRRFEARAVRPHLGGPRGCCNPVVLLGGLRHGIYLLHYVSERRAGWEAQVADVPLHAVVRREAVARVDDDLDVA